VFVYKSFTYCNLCCQQTGVKRVMALSEKSEFILCELNSSLFHDSSHTNGYITALRSVCDAYHLFAIKVKVIRFALSVFRTDLPMHWSVEKPHRLHRPHRPTRRKLNKRHCQFPRRLNVCLYI